MTKEKVQTIANEIEKALAEVAKKHNVEIKYNGGSFDTTSATLKLKINEISKDGIVQTPERIAYSTYAHVYGLKKEWLDKEISLGGDKFVIAGLNTRSRKNVVSLKRSKDGRGFKCPAASVKLAVARIS